MSKEGYCKDCQKKREEYFHAESMAIASAIIAIFGIDNIVKFGNMLSQELNILQGKEPDGEKEK